MSPSSMLYRNYKKGKSIQLNGKYQNVFTSSELEEIKNRMNNGKS